MRFTYKDTCTIATGLILTSSTFIIGMFFNNFTYDLHVLFSKDATQATFDNSLRHYQALYYSHPAFNYTFYTIAAIGCLAHAVRLYKPNPDMQTFEYISLGLYVMGFCVYLTNIRTGLESSVIRNWGEVSENQGLAIIGSSNIILIMLYFGVLCLQAGIWYTDWDYQLRLKEYYAQEKKEQNQKDKAQEKESKGESTATATANAGTTKKTSKKA
ncbi:related to Secretory component protein SHR3 [Saccharomycodes ludwigii]|uniref:Related to Secretory component protein SHR3 n=1 Tax=Saccharomycodes ludwigii TaxID=36035 RepID=A0A376B1U4_9ASCO|nr:hypothetical protein SCDLUD_002966 [Saccharomycodes ludwigii]KAH3901471.1 hypothetical protein SCDLUD_002966 [Saccharomycodes ludwigii]SSD58589.1 related to Secretory component protein SHR3 [Saccharomycodes ludwigii]